jgi:O-antigen/teichoic acid export membrane protein
MSRLSRNISFNLIGQLLIVALGFWGTRLVFHRLGDEALGLLYVALAIYAVLLPILDLGVSSTIVREVACHFGSDPKYLSALVRTGTLFYWSGYAVLGLGIWFASPWLVSHWINLKTMEPHVAVEALRILALALLLMLPRSFYSNLIRGGERMEFNNLIEVGTTALQQGGTILVVMSGGGIVAIAYCYLGSLVLSNLVYIVLTAQFFSWKAMLPGFSSQIVTRNLSYTSHMAAFSILAMVQMESDKALVTKLLPIGLVGFYGVAQTMVARVSRVPGAINQAAFPNFSALFHNGDRPGLMRQYHRLQDLVCYGLVPIFAAIIFAAKPLYTYLLNSQAAQSLLLPTTLLCVGWYMNGTVNMPLTLSLAVGRPDINSRLNFYAIFITLPATAWFIWKWGIVGAGLSSVCYHLYVYSYAVRRWSSECMGISPRLWYLHVLKFLLLAPSTYGAGWLVMDRFGLGSTLGLAGIYLVATAAYLSVGYLLLGDELRQGFNGVRGRLTYGLSRALL